MKLFRNLILSALVIFIAVYANVRIIFSIWSSQDYSFVENFFSITLLLGEMFILLHAVGYAINLIRSTKHWDIKATEDLYRLPDELPEVAVLVAARHEPKEVLNETFRSISNLRYPAKNVYFLDDSSDDSYKKEAEALAALYGLKLFRREVRHGAKAGIVNDCLRSLKEKYVVIFDADQNPMPGFLIPLISMMERDPKLAFIQTPQFYSNVNSCRVARAATYQQSVFYEYICEAKGSSKAMFCCGTNVIFRREALMSVGGLDESVVTEDFATSVKLHMAGWESMYYNHVSAFGMGPETLGSYFMQQSRWAKGTIGVFKKIVGKFFTRPFSMSPARWWEYFLSGTYYFVGIALIFLMICPIAYLLFNVPSFFIHKDVYISVFLPYFTLSLGVFITTLHARHYSVKGLLMAQVLTYITFPVLVVAAFQALFGIQGTFGITQKGKGKALPYYTLWPQILFMMLNFIAFVWGLNRFYYERDFSLIVNCFWVFYHFLAMAGIFYFNEDAPA